MVGLRQEVLMSDDEVNRLIACGHTEGSIDGNALRRLVWRLTLALKSERDRREHQSRVAGAAIESLIGASGLNR
jgi:hypothetical protein